MLASAPSLTRLLDPAVLANPYPLYRELREDPVRWDPLLHAWVVTSYRDCVRVLSEFSADRTPSPEKLESIGLGEFSSIARLMVRQMLFMDPPAHARIRRLASHAFTPHRVAVLREHVGEVVRGLIDQIAGTPQFDAIAQLAEPLPYTITAEMLGVPVADAPQLKIWSQEFAEMLGNFQHNPERAASVARSVEAMTAYFHAAVRAMRVHPRPGLIASFLAADADGDRFTEEEVVANTIVTMVGGQETTTNLIGNGLLTLLRHPRDWERLRARPDLIPNAIEEMLRYEPPSQQTARLAPSDVLLGNKHIRRGQATIAVMAAANRDPERFSAPEAFDIERADNRHLSFGWGAHFCFGAALARMEAHATFEAVLQRFQYLTLEDGGAPEATDRIGSSLEWRTNLGLRGLVRLPLRGR